MLIIMFSISYCLIIITIMIIIIIIIMLIMNMLFVITSSELIVRNAPTVGTRTRSERAVPGAHMLLAASKTSPTDDYYSLLYYTILYYTILYYTRFYYTIL